MFTQGRLANLSAFLSTGSYQDNCRIRALSMAHGIRDFKRTAAHLWEEPPEQRRSDDHESFPRAEPQTYRICANLPVT